MFIKFLLLGMHASDHRGMACIAHSYPQSNDTCQINHIRRLGEYSTVFASFFFRFYSDVETEIVVG